MSRTIIYVHVKIILDFPITYKIYSSALPIRMRMWTSNSKHGSFRLNANKTTSQRGEHSCKCKELSLKRKERMGSVLLRNDDMLHFLWNYINSRTSNECCPHQQIQTVRLPTPSGCRQTRRLYTTGSWQNTPLPW